MTKKILSLIVALSAALTLAACGEGDEDHGGRHDPGSSAIAEDEPFNRTDVDFSTEMIQHHAQALSMVDLVDARTVSQELAELAEQIRMAQGPEIETLVGWLQEWSQPVPETMRDHANSHGDGATGMDSEMPGMMSADEMTALAAARGGEFEQMWLEMMIEHHEGAVEMAEEEKADGEFPAAIELAEAIISAQKAEIAETSMMLRG